jgi:hypothetical protein
MQSEHTAPGQVQLNADGVPQWHGPPRPQQGVPVTQPAVPPDDASQAAARATFEVVKPRERRVESPPAQMPPETTLVGSFLGVPAGADPTTWTSVATGTPKPQASASVASASVASASVASASVASASVASAAEGGPTT